MRQAIVVHLAHWRRNDFLCEQLANDLVAPIAEGPLSGGIELLNVSRCIHDDDAIESGFEDRGKLVAALAHRCVGWVARIHACEPTTQRAARRANERGRSALG